MTLSYSSCGYSHLSYPQQTSKPLHTSLVRKGQKRAPQDKGHLLRHKSKLPEVTWNTVFLLFYFISAFLIQSQDEERRKQFPRKKPQEEGEKLWGGWWSADLKVRSKSWNTLLLSKKFAISPIGISVLSVLNTVSLGIEKEGPLAQKVIPKCSSTWLHTPISFNSQWKSSISALAPHSEIDSFSWQHISPLRHGTNLLIFLLQGPALSMFKKYCLKRAEQFPLIKCSKTNNCAICPVDEKSLN